MKIDSIDVTNVLGVSRVKLTTERPITLIAGDNGAGKSSLQESVRMAIRGEILRVDKKKEYPLLVKEGAKEGRVVVMTDGRHENSVTLPKGEFKSAKYGYPDEVLASVLDAHRFSQLPPDDRRAFLFRLTNCQATPERIKPMLIDRGCNLERVEATLPMLRAGFQSASDTAGKKATEAKGAWRAITGETYGSVKAVGWKATVPEVDQEAIATTTNDLDTLNGNIIGIQRDIATREGAIAEAKRNAEKLNKAKEDAGRLQRAEEKLAVDEASLEQAKMNLEDAQKKAGGVKREGLVHDMYVFINSVAFDDTLAPEADKLLNAYVEQNGNPELPGDPDARASLPALQNSVNMLTRAIENDKRDIAACKAAADLVVEFGTAAPIEAGELEEKRTILAAKIVERNAKSKELDDLRRAALAADQAEANTMKAEAAHNDVAEWSKISDALAPDGIPSELLATALRPVNTQLRESASATGWMQVAIAPDMTITANTRRYQLLSESEKWRTDAMIAEAIAQLSDIRLLMLDRVDVLSLRNRGELIMWLDGRVQAGGLESVLLFGTFKKVPTGIPDSMQAHWIEDGYIEVEQEALAA